MRHKHNRQTRRNQAGMTLIELGLAILVAAIVAGIAIGLYATTTDGARTNNAQTQLMTVVGQTKKMGQGGLFTGVTTHVVAQGGGIPDSMIDKTTATAWKITNPFGGNFTIATATPFTTATIALDKLTTGACTDLVLNTQANFVGIAVKAGTATAVNVKTVGNPANATSAAIATECAKDGEKTVTFTIAA